MQVSLDISLYPLKADYAQAILTFISQLEAEPCIKVVRNTLSTQVFGDFHQIMQLMTKEIAQVFSEQPESVFVLKLVGQNRAPA
ncbi:YkoF family thiamine/hydroxymethylpyrimidine-binding protein [Thiomicrospira sp. ALE5]|uniref:YkoF family thiamine/hydroxymethylpyrimidine-binding protein n=1 Tax=Thiomicrospira sp. ALE5 TaxID=748650 RepID=UPI0008E50A22|nr:YkoF family thiamine/hydroxymethylpyrimidine-binding protein [Thiomicrospira sp. ALE5]SFR60459.1 YKOF-related Family [Thiomicrospira sp. ALE5]